MDGLSSIALAGISPMLLGEQPFYSSPENIQHIKLEEQELHTMPPEVLMTQYWGLLPEMVSKNYSQALQGDHSHPG